jgi:glutaredoxin
MMTTVVLYMRPGCCLCEDAREMLERVRSRHPGRFEIQEQDIEASVELHRRYLERIPVITIDGVESFELVIDESELESRLGIVRAG